jgi:hypothetical protein
MQGLNFSAFGHSTVFDDRLLVRLIHINQLIEAKKRPADLRTWMILSSYTGKKEIAR